jgi:mRNA interferase RelE/StbE
MNADRAFAIPWTETALKLVEAIPGQRIRRLISQRADQPARSPEQQGKPLIGELVGFRSVRAVGRRDRIVYRDDRREITVLIVAVGRRRSGDKSDIYELARKLLRQGLLANRLTRYREVAKRKQRGSKRCPAPLRRVDRALFRHAVYQAIVD